MRDPSATSTIVLVHGFWVTPRSWENFIGHYEARWNYTFTNTFSEADARRAYERYHVPASGGILWGSVLANFQPGHQDVWVNYRNDNRAPLLFVSAEHDHLMPPVVQRSNARHYKSRTITEIKEFPGRAHLMPAEKGWEEVADTALTWALDHAGARLTPARR